MRAAFHMTAVLALMGCSSLPSETAARAGEARPIPAGAKPYAQVAAGFVHTCALDQDGAAFCWGSNEYAQLGVPIQGDDCGGRPCSRKPVAVSGGQRFAVLAAGWVQNCAIGVDGYTYCWGGGALDGKGYMGNGILSSTTTPVRVQTETNFTSVVVGDGHACGLTASGAAYCWGQNSSGQLGDGSYANHAVPVPVNSTVRFQTLSAGAYHTCGVTAANAAYCWGDNRWGQLGAGNVDYHSARSNRGVPALVSGNVAFTTIAAGWEHTCAVSTAGAAFCWGRNDDASQLGDDSDVTHRGVPGAVTGTLQFAALSAGALSTCGRTTTNELYCWGGNYYGGLGNGEVSDRGVGHPVRADGGPFSSVTVGQAHACGLTPNRRLWCWGDQTLGQF